MGIPSGDKLVLDRVVSDVRVGLEIHLLEDPRAVGAHGLHAEEELLGDLRNALPGGERSLTAVALLVAIYGITSLFNSLLWDPTEAYWFLLLAGALYGHCIQRRGTAQ